MAKMKEDQLLSMLQELESNSSHFAWGTLAPERRKSEREYYRQPYGNEEDGWSSIVTSETQDTVEWLLPDLIDMFISSDDAVAFEPTQEADAKGAEQATDACNYVFYKQNNGFLVLYTAFKDALMKGNSAVHWRKETVRSQTKIPFNGTMDELAMVMEEDDKIVGAEQYQQPVVDQTGQPAIGFDGMPIMQNMIKAQISRPQERKRVRIDAFEPDDLLIDREWTSPLLDECPYVARSMEVTLSDLKQMGFKATAEDLSASDQPGMHESLDERRSRRGLAEYDESNQIDTEDESLTKGYLRIEWVLVDFDGDGIAERREIYRLDNKILSNEECAEVPISTGSPILVQHKWDGMSVVEIMSDLQKLKTEMTRAVVNNAMLANNPRKTVLVDGNGAPQADIDDLLDFRQGGIIRVNRPDALNIDATPYVGNQMLPLLEYVEQMGEKRTGVSKQSTGLDPNSLRPDRTAAEVMMTANAASSRKKLMGRILGETIVKPMFKGIFRLLSEGDMEPLSFRLRGEFVQYDPNEWRDGYDMTVNVGLGTGDKEKQMGMLQMIFNEQMQIAPTPIGSMFVNPQMIYNTLAKKVKIGGFQNVGDFFHDPGPQAQLPKPPPPPPDPKIQIKQMELQDDGQKFQAQTAHEAQMEQMKAQLELQRQQAQLELQASNDERDAQRELMKAQYDQQLEAARIELDRYKVDSDNRRAVVVARIAHPETDVTGLDIDPETGQVYEKPDLMPGMVEMLGAMIDQNNAPKIIIRDDQGRPVGVQHGAQTRQVVRDESGRVVGLS